jgi:hypothetical protein
MSMLKSVILGDEGVRYVQSRLKEGGALSQLAQNLVSTDGGVCFAPLPEHVSLERARQFETGGVMTRRMQLEWIKNRMLSFCGKGDKNLLVFEDQVLRRGDKGVSDIPSNIFYYRDEVYYYIECLDVSGNRVEGALREVRSFRSISFLIERCDNQYLETGCTLDRAMLDKMAEKVSEIFVSAFDQEGVLVWSRRSGGEEIAKVGHTGR